MCAAFYLFSGAEGNKPGCLIFFSDANFTKCVVVYNGIFILFPPLYFYNKTAFADYFYPACYCAAF
jgi:hypothetical protein